MMSSIHGVFALFLFAPCLIFGTAAELCENEVKVKLTQTPTLDEGPETLRNVNLNCSFDRTKEDTMLVIFYTGSTILVVWDQVYDRLRYTDPYTRVTFDNNWVSVLFGISDCNTEEDYNCHVIDRADGYGTGAVGTVISSAVHMYWGQECITCTEDPVVYVEEGADVTLSCNITFSRPEFRFIWDGPVDMIPGSEKRTPRHDCSDVLHFDQSAQAQGTFHFDDTQHWHVCCTVEALNAEKHRLNSRTVKFVHRRKEDDPAYFATEDVDV